MIDKKLRKAICNYDKENGSEIHLLNKPSFDGSIIGISACHQVVYDYNRMLDEYVKDNNCSIYDAIDFIDFNLYGFTREYFNNNIVIVRTNAEELKERYLE